MPPSRKRNRTSASPAPSGGGGSPSDDGSSPPASVPGSSPDADEPGPDRPDPRLGGATPDEEEDGEELIGEDMEADYRPMGALDEYEEEGLDANDYVPMSAAARFAADAVLDARDQRERQSRMPAALLTSDDEDDRPRQRRRRPADADLGEGDEMDPAAGLEGFLDDEEGGINLEDYNGPLSEWIISPAVSEEIRRRFRRFLTSYDAGASGDGGGAPAADASSRYSQRVRNMCAANKESLDVSYLHLSQSVPILAIWVADCPKEMFKLLDEAAMEVVRIMFPDYDQIHQAIHVRITNLPIQDSIRDLRQCHMGCLVKIAGVVTRRSGVYPQMKICRYNCTHCGYVMGPYTVNTEETKMQGVLCHSCQAKGPYTLNTEQTVYCNYQKLTLQESPGSVPPGRLPRHKEVVLQWDLIDVARPGEEIEVTGVYVNNFDHGLNRKSGFPVFSTSVEANHVQKKEELMASHMLTDEEKREIHRMSKDPLIQNKIIQSIAPSIYGHDDIKTAIALSMFGGQGKDVEGKHRIRGDINVLLLGDPGTAKSQFLKYIEKTAPRAVYTTGQGASAVGLTAGVHKDPVTREWTLEGGALVLADRGVCLIDEFDKMGDADRTSIHEAMEQQSISISKAGIITSLQARCAVVAAANPLKGRYDSSVSFEDNVDLTQPILSRFDCICVVKDSVDVVTDERLAEFVVKSHRDTHPNAQDEQAAAGGAGGAADGAAGGAADKGGDKWKTAIDQTMLRKYLMHARHTCTPVLQDIDQNKIIQVYTELRQEANNGGVVVAVRHIESMIRMAEASAKMHLRGHVTNDDVDLAISVLLNSVIKSQKYAIARSMEKKFTRYLTQKKDTNQLLEFTLRKLFQHAAHNVYARRPRGADDADGGSGAGGSGMGAGMGGVGGGAGDIVEVETDEFEARAREMAIHDLSTFYASRQFGSYRHAKSAEGRDVIVRAEDEGRAAQRNADADAAQAAQAAEAAAAAQQQQQQGDAGEATAR